MELFRDDRDFGGVWFSAAHNLHEVANHLDRRDRGPPAAERLGLCRALLPGIGQMASIGIGRA